MAAAVYRTCFMCERTGTRGFREVLWGKHKGEYRCTASIPCDKRIYKRVSPGRSWT